MGTRLYPVPDSPASEPTMHAAYARAYGELRSAVQRHCSAYPTDHELLRAHVEGIALKLEKTLGTIIADAETVRLLARPLRSE